MPEVRKLVRDGLRAILAASFNSQYAGAVSLYPMADPIEIDWAPELAPANLPKNFFVGNIEPSELDQSDLQRFPAVCLFTADLDGGPSDRRQKFMKFSGSLAAGLRWFIKHRETIEGDNVEDTISCIDDALLEVLNANSAVWPSGVVWNGDYKSGQPEFQGTGSGFVVIMTCEITFEVHV